MFILLLIYIAGVDGDPDAIYAIQCERENTPYDVDGVHSGYLKDGLHFVVFEVQSTLVISNSKGLSEMLEMSVLRHIRFAELRKN